jgi:hypothetical protein
MPTDMPNYGSTRIQVDKSCLFMNHQHKRTLQDATNLIKKPRLQPMLFKKEEEKTSMPPK